LEQLAPGGQALVIDVLENYPGNVGLTDPEGTRIAEPRTGYEFSRDLQRQAEAFGARILAEQVVGLRKEGNRFVLALGNGETRTAGAVILAAGAEHRLLGIPGEKEFTGRGVSYCATCDGPFFRNKRIFVAGGGDSACDEAQYLSRLSSQVVLVHRRNRLRAQRALAERTLKNPHIEVRFNTVIREIRGERKVSSLVLERSDDTGKGTGETWEEAAEAVFVFAGTVPRSSLAPDAEKDENGYILTSQRMESSVPGLFAAGDVRSSPFRQVVVAAGEGAIAAHCAAGYLDALAGS
jgi:thioredoxin reductase (NADPH)